MRNNHVPLVQYTRADAVLIKDRLMHYDSLLHDAEDLHELVRDAYHGNRVVEVLHILGMKDMTTKDLLEIFDTYRLLLLKRRNWMIELWWHVGGHEFQI